MPTPYIDELALESKNNESISEIITLREEDENGVEVPMDLTGREFFAQARTGKNIGSDLMCDIEVTIYGDPENGQLKFFVSEEVMKDVPAIKGHYDVLTRAGNDGNIDNLYQAPFNVGHGISDVTQWL